MTTKVSFTLPAAYVADATQGILLGEFNNWNTEEGIFLQKKEDGSMVAELSLTPGKTYQYRYLLNDGRWVNDDSSKAYSEIFGYPVENCLIEVPVPSPVKKARVKKESASVAKTNIVKPKQAIVADDLTRIEGIGKKIAALLATNDISTYKALAKCSIKKLQVILDAAGSKFQVHNPATWPKQAKLAASAKWEELEALQASLHGGK